MSDYVVIVDHSAGNESVGEMWKETKVFQGHTSLDEMMEWATGNEDYPSKKNITITRPHS